MVRGLGRRIRISLDSSRPIRANLRGHQNWTLIWAGGDTLLLLCTKLWHFGDLDRLLIQSVGIIDHWHPIHQFSSYVSTNTIIFMTVMIIILMKQQRYCHCQLRQHCRHLLSLTNTNSQCQKQIQVTIWSWDSNMDFGFASGLRGNCKNLCHIIFLNGQDRIVTSNKHIYLWTNNKNLWRLSLGVVMTTVFRWWLSLSLQIVPCAPPPPLSSEMSLQPLASRRALPNCTTPHFVPNTAVPNIHPTL